LVQLSNEGVFVALEVVELEVVLPEIRPESIYLVFELRDGAQGEVMACLELRIRVCLAIASVTFSSESALNW
jgi:hypothetical protein